MTFEVDIYKESYVTMAVGSGPLAHADLHGQPWGLLPPRGISWRSRRPHQTISGARKPVGFSVHYCRGIAARDSTEKRG
jgi:hypothetical protein